MRNGMLKRRAHGLGLTDPSPVGFTGNVPTVRNSTDRKNSTFSEFAFNK